MRSRLTLINMLHMFITFAMIDAVITTLSNSLRLALSFSFRLRRDFVKRCERDRLRRRQSSESIRCIHNNCTTQEILDGENLEFLWQSVALRRKGRIPACSNVSVISHETPSNPFTPSVPLRDTRPIR